MKEFSFQADECLRKIAHDVCEEVNPEIRVFEGRIASGDQFVCDQGVKDNIVKEFSAYAVEMEGIVNHIKKELGGDAYVIATGGFANTMAAESDCIDVVEPFLTLDGLRILYEKNAK